MGAIGKPEALELGLDPRLDDGARNAVQAGMEQQIGRDRQFEIEGWLLEHDAGTASIEEAFLAMTGPAS